MGAWGDERIASEPGIPIQKDHRRLILINQMMAIGRIARKHFADETRPLGPLLISTHIKGLGTSHALLLTEVLS
jgi:hypothetical protein